MKTRNKRKTQQKAEFFLSQIADPQKIGGAKLLSFLKKSRGGNSPPLEGWRFAEGELTGWFTSNSQ